MALSRLGSSLEAFAELRAEPRLRNLESRWPFPEELGTYKVRGQELGWDMGGWGDGGPCAAASHIEAIRQRLEAESPFFQRLQLEPLLNLRFEKKAHVKRVHGCSLLRSEEKFALDRRDFALALTGFDSGRPSLGHMAHGW